MVDIQLLQYLEDFITPKRKERFLEILKWRTRYITVAVEDVYQSIATLRQDGYRIVATT